jgi:hypothetical protein
MFRSAGSSFATVVEVEDQDRWLSKTNHGSLLPAPASVAALSINRTFCPVDFLSPPCLPFVRLYRRPGTR